MSSKFWLPFMSNFGSPSSSIFTVLKPAAVYISGNMKALRVWNPYWSFLSMTPLPSRSLTAAAIISRNLSNVQPSSAT